MTNIALRLVTWWCWLTGENPEMAIAEWVREMSR